MHKGLLPSPRGAVQGGAGESEQGGALLCSASGVCKTFLFFLFTPLRNPKIATSEAQHCTWGMEQSQLSESHWLLLRPPWIHYSSWVLHPHESSRDSQGDQVSSFCRNTQGNVKNHPLKTLLFLQFSVFLPRFLKVQQTCL